MGNINTTSGTNLMDEDGVAFSATNRLPVEDNITSKLRIDVLTVDISIPTAVYTDIYSYTGTGRLIGFNLEFNNSTVIVKLEIDGETVLDGVSLGTLNTLDVTSSDVARRQNGQGIVVAAATLDFSFRQMIRFSSSLVISATGNGATRTFMQGIVYIAKET